MTTLTWLQPGDPFPDVGTAWGNDSSAPGLLAAGGSLDVATLESAYAHGIFPWFSQEQPILWWSTDPRMVLVPREFRLHRSLRQAIKRFRMTPGCEVRFDTAFSQVIRACARSPRDGQGGTWIVEPMIRAYEALHAAGLAHSVETWAGGELVGGLYCVSLGQAVFGESMFATRTDASKIALSALVAFCLEHGVERIDCQQNTGHLASLGAREIARRDFVTAVADARLRPPLKWQFEPVYWAQLSSLRPQGT